AQDTALSASQPPVRSRNRDRQAASANVAHGGLARGERTRPEHAGSAGRYRSDGAPAVLRGCGQLSLVSGGPLGMGLDDRAASARGSVRCVWNRAPVALLPVHLPAITLGGLAARRPDIA